VRILFDQGTPAPLRHALAGHSVTTAFELGWSTLKNGELLAAAEGSGFDVFVTTDRNLRYQQNLAGRRISIVVLSTTSWPRLRQAANEVQVAIDACAPGAFLELTIP
jgi:hypothetical protein